MQKTSISKFAFLSKVKSADKIADTPGKCECDQKNEFTHLATCLNFRAQKSVGGSVSTSIITLQESYFSQCHIDSLLTIRIFRAIIINFSLRRERVTLHLLCGCEGID